MHYKLAPIILTPGKNASTTSDIYIAQPDSLKESLAGKLFILIEIESKKQENLKIINFLVDNINHNYYQNEKILLREKISTLKVEHIFEAALAKTNKNFSDFLHSEKIKTDLDAINIITGIIYEDSIHFVNNGKNKAYLVYRHKIEGKKRGKIKEDDIIEYKISDIIEQAGANKKVLDDKLFTNVVSGKIPKRGHFIITNEALPEYISTKQLIKIVTTLPPASAVEQMKNILSEINSYVTFLGIIIKSTTIDTAEASENISHLNTKDSITSLNRTEETTENLLSTSGVANPKQWMKVPDFINDKIKNSPKSSTSKPFVIKDKIFGKRKSTLSFLKNSLITLKNVISHLFYIFLHVGKKITNREKITISNDNFSENLKVKGENIKEATKQKISKLFTFPGLSSKKNKILLALSVLFIIMFFINISFIKNKNIKKIETEDYQNLIVQIEKKQNQAEAFLLYDNEESAKIIIPEIKTLLDSFPQNTEEQIQKYKEYKDKYDLQSEKIQKIVRLENMNEVANFSNLSANANSENITFSQSINKIYTADSSQNSIYILDLNDNSVTTATDLDTSITQLKSPNLTSDSTIYYLNTDNIIELNSNESLSKIGLDLGNINNNFSSASNYNGKLYLLSSSDSQIYKFTLTNGNFGNGQEWINKKIDLSDGVDISIDGNVYVLKKNGEIIRLLKGDVDDLTIETVSPPFSDASAFAISSDLKFIYILESSNKRLVVFNKNGKFEMQYTSSQFTNLKDFSIDEKNKTIYFLNNNSILKAQASHL